MAKALLYRVDAESLVEVNIDTLDSIYAFLECDTIDHTYLTNNLEVYVDDNGLLKEDPDFGVVFFDGNRTMGVLAGNILIVNHDDEGKTVDLTDEQIEEAYNLPIGVITYRTNHRTLRTLFVDVELRNERF